MPRPVSLDQGREGEENEGGEDDDRSFEPVQGPRAVGKELGEGVWADASKFRSLPAVVGAMAAEGRHLDRPEKGDPCQGVGEDGPPGPRRKTHHPHPEEG